MVVLAKTCNEKPKLSIESGVVIESSRKNIFRKTKVEVKNTVKMDVRVEALRGGVTGRI